MLNFLKKILIIALFFFTTNLFAGGILTEDIEIKASAKGLNLGGHTATIVESGVVLEKISNGQILVSASVGPGLITLKNCQNISVSLESGVYLLLDGKTEIDNLYIKENAMIDSLENFQAEARNKKINLKKKANIKKILIQNDCSPVIKNVDFEAKEIIQSSEEKISETKKLSIYKDKEYKDSGVRFIIENIPEEADTLQVFLKKNDVEEQISWIGEKIHSKLFHSGFYEYEFLLAGKEYEFIFIYSSEKKVLVKYYIKVVPEKGFDVQLDKENIKLNVDGETGIVSWDSTPSINLPSGAELVYDFCSIDKKNNWHFAGSRRTDYKNFESFNMYDDVKWYFPGNIINGRVLLNIYFSYEDIRWSITQTEQFEIKDMF